MVFRTPTIGQLREIADELGFAAGDDDLADMRAIMEPMAVGYRTLDGLADEVPAVRYPRTPGYRPEGDDNPYGAWYVKTDIRGAARGKLKGRRVAVKDNICVAGVPMMNGASVLEGYVPELDATVVTRILDAGGIIAGKTVCEYLCTSGGSHTSATGPVRNPHKPTHTTGGSSSGSAAAVAAGDVDLALGCDQAGSVRQPAGHCGIYAMKGTYGLVPYTGIMAVEATVDHCGPMTADVAGNALLLEVIAGADGLDPRQREVRTARYTKALGKEVRGLKVAVVKEGFEQVNAEDDVNRLVRAGARKLARLGMQVEEVSIPWHLLGLPIWSPIVNEGLALNALSMNGTLVNYSGLQMASAGAAFSRWRNEADDLADTFKVIAMFGTHALRAGGGRYYAKAQNLVRRLRAAYDAVLAEYDLLLMPTMPLKARPIPGPEAGLREIAESAFLYIANCCSFNLTGHPAMSLPCGKAEDIPVGMMLIGRQWQETTLYRAAYAFEQTYDWRRSRP